MSKPLFAKLLAAGILAAGLTMGATPLCAAARPVTVVLVHGAFENSAVWNAVIPILQRHGVKVVAVQNPLTSLAADVQNTARNIDNQDGDVVLVGHSYGGTVITEAGNNDKVKALVYVAAVSPNSGESGLDEAAPYPKPALLGHLFVDKQGMAYATKDGIDDLAQDVSASERRVLLVTQGPIAFTAFQGKVSHAAWASKPSWSIVADNDHAISPQEEADSAVRIKAKITHLKSGHEVMLAKPQDVATVILQAYQSVAADH
ncbi:MAG: alpha/beta hydrolase [Rhizomicrobium sp.]